MATTIYVTFHRNLYNIYHQMPPNVQCIGVEVRPEFPKTIVTTIPVIKEHNLPGYIDLQKYRFNESSVIVNLRHHICFEIKDEFFGFFQYDMIPSASWLQKMQAAQTSKDVCVCGWLAPAAASLGHSIPVFIPFFHTMIHAFNSKYKTSITFEDIFGGIPLLSNFVIHASVYQEMIDFYMAMTPYITMLMMHPDVGTTHIAGFMERFWGVFLKCRFGDEGIVEIPVEHADYLRVAKDP